MATAAMGAARMYTFVDGAMTDEEHRIGRQQDRR